MDEAKTVPNADRYLTVPEAAMMLGITRHAVYKAIRADRIAYEMFRGRRVILKADVRKYAEERIARKLAGGRGG